MSHDYAIYLIYQEINRIDKDLIKAFMEDDSDVSRVFMLKNLQMGKEALLESIKILEAKSVANEMKKAD